MSPTALRSLAGQRRLRVLVDTPLGQRPAELLSVDTIRNLAHVRFLLTGNTANIPPDRVLTCSPEGAPTP